jgi:hypothetical protein
VIIGSSALLACASLVERSSAGVGDPEADDFDRFAAHGLAKSKLPTGTGSILCRLVRQST